MSSIRVNTVKCPIFLRHPVLPLPTTVRRAYGDSGSNPYTDTSTEAGVLLLAYISLLL